MAESLSTILVHEQVKAVIEAHGIDTLKFVHPDDFANV